jgi:hypothetical protein
MTIRPTCKCVLSLALHSIERPTGGGIRFPASADVPHDSSCGFPRISCKSSGSHSDTMKILVPCDMMSRPVVRYRRFGSTCCLCLQDINESSRFLRKISTYLPNYLYAIEKIKVYRPTFHQILYEQIKNRIGRTSSKHRECTKCLPINLKGYEHLEDLHVDEKMILKWI